MATSSVSSTTSAATTAADVAAANRANAQKILSSLSAGSGVDVNALAQNLVDAERVPQENAINAKISSQEKKISGYSALSFALSNIKDKFNVLKVKSDFNTLTVNSSDTTAFSVTPGAYASPADYEINVESVAKPQRTLPIKISMVSRFKSTSHKKAMTFCHQTTFHPPVIQTNPLRQKKAMMKNSWSSHPLSNWTRPLSTSRYPNTVSKVNRSAC